LDNPDGGLTARHTQWLVKLLDQLWQGHELFDHRPMTLVVTTDDLPVWQHPRRKFAALHEGRFSTLGPWGGDDFDRNPAVRELLAGPIESKDS
jgi:hypothetical protein